ncbi:MAG: hypothetical protein ACXIUL_00005, partial [Wenzhouxiangella sp.]
FGVLRRSIGYDRGESGEIRPIAGCNRDQTPAGHGSGYCWNSVNRAFILPILKTMRWQLDEAG